MSNCKIYAPNGERSNLHGSMFRYYKETGLSDDAANAYATADWVNTNTPSFKHAHNAVLIDPNNEPEVFYSKSLPAEPSLTPQSLEDIEAITKWREQQTDAPKRLAEVSDKELHEGLAEDRTPFYLKLVRGVKTRIDAARAKPSAVGYKAKVEAPDDVQLFARHLSEKFNVPVEFVNRDQAAELYRTAGKPYKGQSAFVVGGKAYAVSSQASKANLVHEIFGHPLLELLQREQPHTFNGLVNEVMRNEEIKRRVQEEYPEEVRSSGNFTEDAKKEAVLMAFEMDAADQLKDTKGGSGVQSMIRRFWEAIRKILGIDKQQPLSSISTVGDLTRLVLGQSTLNLGKYVPEKLYSTTAGAVAPDAKAVADEIVRLGTLDGRITFDRSSGVQEEYRDSENLTKKISRSSNVVNHDFGREQLDRDHLEEAKNEALSIFSNAKKDSDIPTDKVQLEGNPKEYNFKELIYKILRDRNDARMYGNIGHQLAHMAFNDDPILEDELKEMCATKYAPDDNTIVIQSPVPDPYARYNWLFPSQIDPSDQGALNELKQKVGYEVTDAEPISITEHIIYDEQWNIAGRPDLTLVYPGRKNPKTGEMTRPELGTIDYKFGNIEKGLAPEIMEYFDLSSIGGARVSRLNLATMNMILRNVMLKKKMPDLRWKFMKIASMKNAATRVRLLDTYSVQQYLDAISRWEAKNHPQYHEANKAAGLYDVDNYFGETLETYKMMAAWEAHEDQDVNELIKDPDKAIISITNTIVGLTAQIQAMGNEPKLAARKVQAEADRAALSAFRLQLQTRTRDPQRITEKDDDLGDWIIWHNQNQYDVSIEIISALKDLRNEKVQIREERKVHREKIHQKLIDDLKRLKGISKFQVIGGMPYYKGDGKGFWDFMFVERPLKTGKPGTEVYLISKTRDTEKYNALRKEEKAYVDYALNNMEKAYNRAVANRMVRDVNGKMVSKAVALGLPTKWDPNNAMAYVPLLPEEESERKPGVAEAMKRMGRSLVSAFTVTDYDPHAKEHAGLPVKYCYAPDNIRSEKGHSLVGEHIFSRFMEHMDSLELMEEVYGTAKGVETMMRYYNMDGKVHYKNALQYLEKYIYEHIEGKREIDEILAGHYVGKDKKIKAVSVVKMMEATKTLNTFVTLSFQPVLAGLNLTLIHSLNYKHAAENLVAKHIAGVKDIDFGIKELALGQKDYAQLQFDIASGRQESNKLYQILKEWKWAPDNYDFVTSKKDMGYVRNRALDPGHLTFLHQITEDSGNISILAALLRAQKVKAGGKQISVYDAYTVNEETDPETGVKTKVLGWKAGVRGHVKVPFGAGERVIPLTKLVSEEIDNMKKLSARLTGDYRQDERGAAESYALWNFVKQFKRFMFRYFKNMMDEGKWDATLGKYIETGQTDIDMHSGEKVPVLRWQRVYSEGWARTAANGLGCALLLTNIPGLRQLMARSKEDADVFIEKYRWSNLSDFQKTNVIRAASNFLFIAISLAAYAGFDDDDSFIATRLKRMIGDMAEGGNLTDTLRSWEKPAPALSKMKNILQYGGQFFVSEITEDRTREGDLRGAKDLRRQFGVTAAWDQAGKIFEGK